METVGYYTKRVHGKAVDDRQHGPDAAQMPLEISIPDLILQVREHLPPDTPVPSEIWVRFSFWPHNQFSETAKCYKCRFDVNIRFNVDNSERHMLMHTTVLYISGT